MLAILATGIDATAQDHTGHQPAAPEHQHDMANMTTLFPQREASGTAWQPDLTPMNAFHRQLGEWSFMGHANVFGQFLYESGEVHRTSRQAGSINWFMAMLRRPVGEGRLGFRAMLSLEPWTIGGCGYPDLLATGEVCGEDSIHDLQHPHDLFMELAAEYERPIGAVRLHAYAALAGEPALGPAAFPHRASAFANPIAPISHHWLDATHIAFGVVTAGVSGSKWRVEGSAFNGREPDEARTDIDLAALDSTAARVSLLPTDRWALQVSAGHLREAEEGIGHQAPQDVDRITASVAYHRPLRDKGFWASTIAFGANSEAAVLPDRVFEQTTRALLLESAVSSATGRHNWFGRLDIVGKLGHDLHINELEDEVFTVAKVQVGYLRQLATVKGWAAGIGGHLNLSVVPPALAPRYGGRVAPGFGVFFNLHPSTHDTNP